MSDQRLQEAWSCFAQTEPGHVVVSHPFVTLGFSMSNFFIVCIKDVWISTVETIKKLEEAWML